MAANVWRQALIDIYKNMLYKMYKKIIEGPDLYTEPPHPLQILANTCRGNAQEGCSIRRWKRIGMKWRDRRIR